MQDQPFGHSDAVASTSIEDLDLVTAELRRQIADIGLAVVVLRQETGRLRASCGQAAPSGIAGAVTDRAEAVEPVLLAVGASAGGSAVPSEPAPVWGAAPAAAPMTPSAVAPTPMTATPMTATQTMAPPQPTAPTMWGHTDDADAAAFEAFFSAEIEPEPAQRWLLSD